MADLTIRNLIERITSGDIRIPAFQRDFVWEPDQVAFLVDSIYKGFPIGTVVFWQTDERLKTEKDLGAFTLPEPKRDYPVNYVLDGQQRLTSLFSVFQTQLEPKDDSWVDVYFDLESGQSVQESNFYALDETEVDVARHFPIKTFFDTVSYRTQTRNLNDQQAELVDSVQEKFKEYRIINQTFETSDKNEVAIVFERINRAGTELDVFELLAAWSWSDEFDLIEKFGELQDKIRDHGYNELVNDRSLQLRICAAIITGETSPNKILELQGDDIRSRFDEIEAGIIGAIDFLKRELSVKHYKMLPFPGILVPLSAFFATVKADGVPYDDNQRAVIIKWFWRSVLGRRFSSDVTARQANDVAEMKQLQINPKHNFKLPNYDLKIDFTKHGFSTNNANSKTLILMLLGKLPRSFISGAQIDAGKVLKKGSKHEFHHIFPKKYLEKQGIGRREANCLANMCFLTRSDNVKISAKPPQEYFSLMPPTNKEAYLDLALCEARDQNLDFAEFINVRAERLESLADILTKI